MDDDFKQLCVIQGCKLGESTEDDFINIFKKDFGVRVKFCEEVITNGSKERNEEGGRTDIFFYIHDDDILDFAFKRIAFGVRWWEDVVVYNDGAYLYPQAILDKYVPQW